MNWETCIDVTYHERFNEYEHMLSTIRIECIVSSFHLLISDDNLEFCLKIGENNELNEQNKNLIISNQHSNEITFCLRMDQILSALSPFKIKSVSIP